MPCVFGEGQRLVQSSVVSSFFGNGTIGSVHNAPKRNKNDKTVKILGDTHKLANPALRK